MGVSLCILPFFSEHVFIERVRKASVMFYDDYSWPSFMIYRSQVILFIFSGMLQTVRGNLAISYLFLKLDKTKQKEKSKKKTKK